MNSTFPSSGFEFLQELHNNNNRAWFGSNKETFEDTFKDVKAFFKNIHDQMVKKDSIEKFHVHRIYRDVRFSKDKTPYKTYFGLHLGRKKPLLRGGYYVNIEPGKSFVGGGFWEPSKEDLNRIRKEIELDDSEFRRIVSAPKFLNTFDKLKGEELKTAPRGFNKDHPAIDLLRKKQFLLMRSFTDKEVLNPDFTKEVIATFEVMRPLFDYMSFVLTTDANGEPLFENPYY
jgi:uncharacterized protein (TIGR02453 family)